MTVANLLMRADPERETEMNADMIARWFVRLVGLSLVVASLGMWVAPNATTLPELMMIKLCASFFFAMTGGYLLYFARTSKSSRG